MDRKWPRAIRFRGSLGSAVIVGVADEAAALAAACCGDETVETASRVSRGNAASHARSAAEIEGIAFVGSSLCDADREAGAVILPLALLHKVPLPADADALAAQLRATGDKEDLRRIRKAAFVRRIDATPDAVRRFYADFYRPYITRRHAEEASLDSVERLVAMLEADGELLCLEQDGEWLAGLFAARSKDYYALRYIGIRDGRADIVALRAIPALFVNAMERAIELGYDTATFGRTLPLLGEGNARFKTKWGSVLTLDPFARETAALFLDLRHETARRFLARTPIAVRNGDTLEGVRWLDEGPDALKRACRDVRHFRGLSRWHVLGDAATLDAGAEALGAIAEIRTVAVEMRSEKPIWLATVLRS